MATFSKAEWEKIYKAGRMEDFGLPEQRSKSVILGTFNIRKLGSVAKRSPHAWSFLAHICTRFDLLAIQEVLDNMDGLRYLRDVMGSDYGIVASDVSGGLFNIENFFPSKLVNSERLAFLFNRKRIRRTELAADIYAIPIEIAKDMLEKQKKFSETWRKHKLYIDLEQKWRKKAKAGSKRKPKAPPIELPAFLTIPRQPHFASFEIVPRAGEPPLRFLAINAHIQYGSDKDERDWEFGALIEWLVIRAENAANMYYPNLVLLGDCNLEFETFGFTRNEFNDRLKTLNNQRLKSKKAAQANFPLLTPHPLYGELHTNARMKQTNDQIGIFTLDENWPLVEANRTAGLSPDGFDYGVFMFTELFAKALHAKSFAELTRSHQLEIIKKCEFEISDHMPAWFRMPIPGA